METMYPLYTTGLLSGGENLFYGLLIGIMFGFILERAGFGTSKHIAPIFYFKNLRVSEVMVSAIVTCATWLVIASWNGWIDYNIVFIPDVYVWPYLVGGLLFGLGMVMAGWCPGTAVVGVATGKIDAAVFLLGIMAGMYFYFDIYDSVMVFANSGYIGRYTIDVLLGGDIYTSSYLVTILLAVGLAIFMNTMKSIMDKKGEY
jgi:uncharacterized membrane protein YedE/YeeE